MANLQPQADNLWAPSWVHPESQARRRIPSGCSASFFGAHFGAGRLLC
jgi:hypothetical protein